MIHISRYDVFKMKKGLKVFNKKTEETGVVVSIEETAPECIEPKVRWENGVEEILKSYPHIFVEENDEQETNDLCDLINENIGRTFFK